MESAALDEALRALAHSDRRSFVQACMDREQAAGDLAAMSALSLATVSEHLKVLRKSGLLVLDRRGRFWMYRTDAALLADIAAEITRIGEQTWDEKH